MDMDTCIIMVVGALIIWLVGARVYKYSKKQGVRQLYESIRAFREPNGCKSALAQYQEAIRICRAYGVLISEIGISDPEAFHMLAVRALERHIKYAKTAYPHIIKEAEAMSVGAELKRKYEVGLQVLEHQLIELKSLSSAWYLTEESREHLPEIQL